MFTREEHAVVPCEPTTTSPLTVRHEIHMCCAPAPCQHCSRTAGTTQNAVGAVLAVQKTVNNFRLRPAARSPTSNRPTEHRCRPRRVAIPRRRPTLVTSSDNTGSSSSGTNGGRRCGYTASSPSLSPPPLHPLRASSSSPSSD